MNDTAQPRSSSPEPSHSEEPARPVSSRRRERSPWLKRGWTLLLVGIAIKLSVFLFAVAFALSGFLIVAGLGIVGFFALREWYCTDEPSPPPAEPARGPVGANETGSIESGTER